MGKAQSKPILPNKLPSKRKNSLTNPNNPNFHVLESIKKDHRRHVIYEYINKRKYSSSYVLPLDDDEVDRLTLQHYVFSNIWESDFSSPVHRLLERGGAKVLDVGCGPGVFVLEMANKYTKTSFTGVDIADNYPQFIKPENTSFQITNITDGLPFADNSFDFVYMRFMMFAITIESWQFVINELTRVCKPGGWVEVMERDIHWYNEGEMVNKWRTKVVEGLRNEKGVELNISSHIPSFFKSNRQLTNFSKDERIEPIGSWAGILGTAYAQVIKWGARNLSHALSNIKFEGDYEQLIEIAMEELEKNKAFDKSYRFWAMKKSL